MAAVLATARSFGPSVTRLSCRWIRDPATGKLVCVWEEDPLQRRPVLHLRLVSR